jgi:hypothetical protein
MQKSLPIIVLLALLALAGFILFFVNQSRLSDQESLVQEQMMAFQEEQQRLAEIEQSLLKEKAESDRLAREALEARQMAEALAEEERRERERLIVELNERLKQEARERAEAEAAQRDLEQRMEALYTAQQEAQAALAMLQSQRQASAEGEEPEQEAELRQKLQDQQSQLAALETENQALKERQQLLESRQIATEEAIASAGGRVSIPYPEIRSPNVRRREAILFKQRLSSHSDPEQ